MTQNKIKAYHYKKFNKFNKNQENYRKRKAN